MKAASEFIHTALHTAVAYAWWARLEISSKFVIPARPGGPSNRHALLLAWALPPVISGGVYRPTSFLKYGSELGWRMSAISGPATEDSGEAGRYLLDTIPEAVRIHRLDRPVLRPSWRFSPQLDGGFLNALATAQLAFRIFKDDPPAVVIASGPPFHNFVAAHFIARFFGAKLVLDYRDEWNECPFDFVETSNMDRVQEIRCLREARAVIFTTESQLEQQVAAFASLQREKCCVVPNGWEPADFDTAGKLTKCRKNSNEKVVISYLGLLAPHSDPSSFLELLNGVLERRDDLRRRIKIRFVGHVVGSLSRTLEAFQYKEVLDVVDRLPKPEAIEHMRESDALLILAEPGLERYLPGKLYDYIAAGTPILVYGHTGEVSRLVEQLDVGTFVHEGDVNALAQALDSLVEEPRQRLQGGPERESWLQQHTREALARRFFDILEGL